MKKIAFHANQLGLRGTETSMFNYADYNEKILGNKSIILANPDKELTTLKKYDDYYISYESYSPEKVMNKFNKIFLS
jgi:hypothetical protein